MTLTRRLMPPQMPGVAAWKALCTALLTALFATFPIAGSAQRTGACADFLHKLPNFSLKACDAALLQAGEGRSVKGRPLLADDLDNTCEDFLSKEFDHPIDYDLEAALPRLKRWGLLRENAQVCCMRRCL